MRDPGIALPNKACLEPRGPTRQKSNRDISGPTNLGRNRITANSRLFNILIDVHFMFSAFLGWLGDDNKEQA